MSERCFFAPLTNRPCDGPAIWRIHLIPKQTLKRKGHDVWDPRSWVPSCGGISGLGGHHGHFDGYQLVVPRDALPPTVEELAAELGIGYYLDRRYGVRHES